MSSTATMDLSVLKLHSPRKRMVQSARFTFDTDYVHSYLLTSNDTSPRSGSPPSSISRDSTDRALEDDDDDDTFTIFEQHQAAIPFKWEETPGTCKDTAKTGERKEDTLKGISESESEDYFGSNSSDISRSSSSGTRSSTSHEHDFVIGALSSPDVSGAESFRITLPVICAAESFPNGAGNERLQEIFSVAQSGPLNLKPPPGKSSIRQLLTLEGDERSITSTISKSRGLSFRRDGLKALSFLTPSSNKKACGEQVPSTLLGLEDWPKVVEEQEKQEAREKLAQVKQEKQEKQEKQANEKIERQIQATSASRFSFSFRKKPVKDDQGSTVSGANIVALLGTDDIFSEDLGMSGRLKKCRPLQCMSSRGLADGYSKPKSWAYDSDNEYSDNETDAKHVDFDLFGDIAEEEPQNFALNNDDDSSTRAPKTKQKRHRRANTISRVFGVNSNAAPEKDTAARKTSKPSRLAAVSPAPPATGATLAPSLGNQKHSKVTSPHHNVSAAPSPATITKNPLLKLCLSTAIGQALFRNVKHFRSFEFNTPRSLTAK